jgi:cell division transport system permease protein
MAIGAVLSLAAGAELFLVLAERSLSQQARSASEFQVFLADDARPDQVDALSRKIGAVPGVRRVSYRSKSDALAVAQHEAALADIAAKASANPFPASLVVDLEDPAAATRVAAAAADDPSTDREVPFSYTPDQGRRLSGFLSMARAVVAGVALGALGLASLVALVLIRSEVRSRRAELSMLALVGTPRPVIRLPVLVEALSLGLVGSLIAAIAVAYAAGHLVPAVNGSLPFLQLGSGTSAVQTISLATLAGSLLALGGSSLLVRLPR